MPIECLECGEYFEVITGSHLRHHGMTTWDYRLKHLGAPIMSKEVREAIGFANSGLQRSPEQREALSLTLTQRHREDPGIANRISEALFGRLVDQETRGILSAAQEKAYRDNPNLGDLHSKIMIEKWKDPDYRRTQLEAQGKGRGWDFGLKISRALTGCTHDPDFGRRCSEGHKRSYEKHPEIAERISETHKKNWEDPVYARERMESWRKSPNETEATLFRLLEKKYPGQFGSNLKGELANLLWDWGYKGRRQPDIVRIIGSRQVIFSNGNHWHPDEDEGALIQSFQEVGISCLVVWADSWGDIVVDWPKIAEWIDV